MASTPPPLPSSSDDSDFDDDDFGCFSSAPVKAINNVLQTFEKKSDSGANESVGSLTDTADTTSFRAENKNLDGSDNDVSVSDHSEHVEPKEEQLSTDIFASDKFDDAILSEPTQVLTKECNISEKQNSNVLETKDSVESKETDAIDQVDEEKCVEDCDLRDKNETEEHSIAEDADKSDEFSERDNSLSDVDSKSSINEISDDSDTNFNHAQSDVTHPADSACASKDEADEFGEWSDMQTHPSDGVIDHEASGAQNECLDNERIKDHDSEAPNDIATVVEKDKDDNLCDSPHPSLSPRNDSPNIPLDTTSEETGHNQYSISPDNGNDHENDDDDGFGDFADFSSHQVNDNDEEETILPLSFKTSSSDDKEEAKSDDDDDNNDISDTKTVDQNNVTKKFNVNSNVENSGLNDAGDDFDDDWGFKSAETNDKENVSDDFGNFGSANNGNGDSDWASFNETAPGVTTNDDDDFNDFSENDFQESPFPQSESVSSKIQESGNKVEKVVSMCFPEDVLQVNQTYASQKLADDCDDTNKIKAEVNEIDNLSSVVEMGLKVTPKAKEETWTIVQELRNKDPVVGTWGRLKDFNSSHALDYGWNSSHCCQEIFSTLHIDTKNVLFSQKKQAVPFYASGLGILEPIRGGANPADKNQPSVAPIPTLLDTTSKPEEGKKSLDIPPVNFDWGSSGLTNPLKVFKNDSFNNGLSSLEPFSDVLHKNIEPTKELSSEAKSILSKIPNLNFMRSNVLMFPIKD